MSSISCAGISPAYLAENGIRHVGPEEANQLVGCAHAGRLFPYFQDRAGARVPIGDPDDTPFFRLRKDGVIAGNKYHQAARTRQHGYLPINWAGGPEGSPLTIGEGEKKTLSLTDPHLGAVVPAVGIGGFFSFLLKQEGGQPRQLLPELQFALNQLANRPVAFLGDNDTALNSNFSLAATRLKQSLGDREVLLPRIPLNEPKGIDDVRQKLGSRFQFFFDDLLRDAIVLSVDVTAEQLALSLLEREIKHVAAMAASDRFVVTKKIAKLGARLDATARAELHRLVKKPLSIGSCDFRAMVKEAAKEFEEQGAVSLPERLKVIRPKVQDYHYDGGRYYRKSGPIFVPLGGDENLQQALRLGESLDGGDSLPQSDADLGLYLIQRENSVVGAISLAGHEPGPADALNGRRVLVLDGPTVISGADSGDATIILELLRSFFGADAGEVLAPQQLITFLAWLKRGRLALLCPDQHLPAPALVLVSPTDTGKTFLQDHLITPSLGGRQTNPTDFWLGRTQFNEVNIGSEHLAVSDPDTGGDPKLLARFHHALKQTIANEAKLCSPKFKAQIPVRPIQVVSIALNTEQLALIPVKDPSTRDKLILLRCHRAAGLPGEAPAERRAFLGQIKAALPAFLGQLDRFEIPQDFRDGRFGVAAFQHPELLRMASASDPVLGLAFLLDEFTAAGTEPVAMTARQWFGVLVERFGDRLTSLAHDPVALAKGFSAIRRALPGWTTRLGQSGQSAYNDQRNRSPLWQLRSRS